MQKLKVVVFVETLIILGFIGYLVYTDIFNPNSYAESQVSYCSKHFYDSKTCLISPRIYTGILKSNNFLILNFKPLQQDVQDYLDYNNLTSSVALYVLNLQDSVSFGINYSRAFEPASLNKLPIAIVILKKVELGELTLDTLLPIQNIDRDSRSGTLYNTTLNQMNVKDLLYHMLSESDNTAFRVLEGQVTLKDLQGLSSYLNYYTKDIDYTTLNNTYQITPKSTANLFLSLYLSTDLKPEHSEMILSLLTNTTYDEFDLQKYASLPSAGLPSSVIVADKYGSYYVGNEKYFHDCGIMYLPDNRIFYCVMTQGLSKDVASNSIGIIVNKIYNFVIHQKTIPDLN
ncbi:Beta-lactamase enzyme family protein [uncultured archaeon]|nr:Beta-lactamase enzyme family protein [uncultured archaeon]